ncbi:MAG: hypothetical protein IJY71_04705 [Clostridia bacterium]|nr:hypothetical protein [Clostridia bacterium]
MKVQQLKNATNREISRFCLQNAVMRPQGIFAGGAKQARPMLSPNAPLLPSTKNQVERLGFFINF